MHNKWWHERIFYQIYPRSFSDSNGDGIGDLQGIISKLPYLKSLGIGALWLSPVYPSPNFDMGYDISDYTNINPEYGTMDDMKELLAEAKKLDIKIVMDLVINHTSYEHEWFIKSKDPSSPYHNYYFWKKGRTTKSGKRRPPNNWQSVFSGSAWTYETSNDMYYLNLFTPQQVDLNYNNPQVIEEVKNVMRFWLDLGVAGFRCDVINLIAKTSFKNGKQGVYRTGIEHYLSQPQSHTILKELHRDVLSKYDAYTVGETTDINLEGAKLYLDEELTQIFPFDHTSVDHYSLPFFKKKYKAKNMIKAMRKWQENVEWNTLFLENHDIPRSISRFGSLKHPLQSGSALLAMVLTLRGTPYIYQGQEIGMLNSHFKDISVNKDVTSINVYNILKKVFLSKKIAMHFVNNFSRDHARTPMQWDDSLNAGFTSGKPWLQINPNYKQINVAANLNDENSLLSHYKKLVAVRQNSAALTKGEISFLQSHRDVFAYKRSGKDEEILVVINLGAKHASHKLNLDGQLLYGNYDSFSDDQKKLRPFEVQIIKII